MTSNGYLWLIVVACASCTTSSEQSVGAGIQTSGAIVMGCSSIIPKSFLVGVTEEDEARARGFVFHDEDYLDRLKERFAQEDATFTAVANSETGVKAVSFNGGPTVAYWKPEPKKIGGIERDWINWQKETVVYEFDRDLLQQGLIPASRIMDARLKDGSIQRGIAVKPVPGIDLTATPYAVPELSSDVKTLIEALDARPHGWALALLDYILGVYVHKGEGKSRDSIVLYDGRVAGIDNTEYRPDAIAPTSVYFSVAAENEISAPEPVQRRISELLDDYAANPHVWRAVIENIVDVGQYLRTKYPLRYQEGAFASDFERHECIIVGRLKSIRDNNWRFPSDEKRRSLLNACGVRFY